MNNIWPLPQIQYKPLSEHEEKRDIALIYSAAALEAVSEHFKQTPVSQAEVLDATQTHWDQLALKLNGNVIYAIGGGVAVDAAKYIGHKTNKPVVSIPTALTVDAFFTWAAGIRQNGCVRYLETGPPTHVIIDLKILSQAPTHLRAAGLCDVLSIATGSWDWRFAHRHNKLNTSEKYEPWANRVAQEILQAGLECAEAAGAGDATGLKQLIDCLALEVQLCNQIGHARPEEGSEHYFAYAAESLGGKGLPHGDLVGPGICLIAERQKQDPTPLKTALQKAGVPLNSLSNHLIEKTFKALPQYVQQHDLPFGIAHTINQEL